MSYSQLQSITPSGLAVNFSASNLVDTGSGWVVAVVVNSHSSGTLKIWDSTAASGTVLFNTITLSAVATTGERFIPFFGAKYNTGLYITVGGTIDATIIYNH